ncbi:MAG: CDP-diacylglycerol--glycerol-3-phosphate 3-phosphatidyltransferase [Ruminococcaceae bacterium]|nr:CDP-diacylglycerol--glycerol-3-phosphate 3-phosphatidyltransferase [Oscillospiraceae bacterium]
MNLPNKLTVLRMIMVPIFLVVLVVPLPIGETAMRIAAAVIFALTSLTDMLDGKIARKYNLVTDFGKLMDPLADKFLVIAAMVGILVRFGYLSDIFVWAVVIVVFRELAVTSIRCIAAQKKGLVVAASWLGKVKTTTQMICVISILLEPVILPFKPFTEWHLLSYVTTAAMTVMTLWSGIDYLKAYWPLLDPEK